MSVVVQTYDILMNDKLVNQEGLVTFRRHDGDIADLTAYVNGDVYYAHIGRNGIADVFSAPANILSLEDRLALDFHKNTSKAPSWESVPSFV